MFAKNIIVINLLQNGNKDKVNIVMHAEQNIFLIFEHVFTVHA